MQKKIVECVPNFSEGRDMGIIKQITDVIEAVDGVKLLDVDPSLRVKEVSLRLGFSSSAYFCNVYRQFWGQTPRD